MTPEEFENTVRQICDAKTSAHGERWTPENPFLGHCTVVSILAQDIFGGDILRADLRGAPGFEDIKWHSWNRLPDGREVDFTASQLEKPIPKGVPIEIRTRENLFSYPTIKDRYEILKSRFKQKTGFVVL